MNDKENFAETQPKDGDTVLHCGHIDCPPHHFWQCDITFRRPDGTMGHATWIVACGPCFQKANGEGDKIAVRGDAKWRGNGPIVVKPT